MSTATSFAHTVARAAGVDIEHLIGLDTTELSVLYYGMLSDDASRDVRAAIDHLETDAVELYATRGGLPRADRAYCRYVLALRAVKARH
jgi:hypothetical protein